MDNHLNRYPFTYHPEGWYFVAYAPDLRVGKLVGLSWLGKEIVVWRCHAEDSVSAAVAICPHLGARLTPEYGGKLIDGRLACPFHGFRYDSSGTCVSGTNPSEPPPRNCRLDMIPVCEVNGIIMGYHGGTPRFHLPELDEDGWTGKIWNSVSLQTHIQEVVENMVDLNHFYQVHDYERIEPVGEPVVEECHFTSSIDMNGRFNLPLLGKIGYDASVEFHLWGLGYFFWETSSPDFGGLRIRNWLLCVPENDALKLHYGVAINDENGSRAGAKRFTLGELRRRLIRWLVLYELGITIKQDQDIWNGKSYRDTPRLIPSDGPIFMYRQYCQQFY